MGAYEATRKVYGKTLCEIGADERIVVFDADLTICTMTCEFASKYPERFYNAAIIESSGVGLDEFFERLKGGDEGFREIWEDYLDKLAIVMNNLRMIFDCDVVIGGEISRYFADYLDTLRERVRARHLFGRESDYVKLCSYIYEGPAKGAALYYIDMFISGRI